MSLFGKSAPPATSVKAVPVFTVQSLNRQYQPLTVVSTQISGLNTSSKAGYDKAINELGVQAASIGADAVIGLFFHNQAATSFMAFGTAIKYTD